VHPQKAVVGGSAGKNEFGFSCGSVHLFEPVQKTWERARANSTMPPHFHVPGAQLARDYTNALLGIGIFHPQQIFG
jgi:hypothetical protein